MRHLIPMLFIAALTAGCTKSVDEMTYSELRSYAAQMEERCRKQGVVSAPEMQACVSQEARADQSRRMKQRQIGDAISAAGDEMSRNARANRPINCTSTGMGNMVRTTCF
jgi:hypothetical protein